MVVLRDDNGSYQVTRVIQWLSGERAVDVPSEFDIPKGTGGDQPPLPRGECLELHSLPALNKQSLTTTSERSCLLARRLHRLSPDTQTFDEAYCTLSSRQSAQHSHSHDLRRASSTSESCSLSSATPISTSSPVLSLYVDESFVDGTRAKMDSDFDRRDCQLLPSITNSDDRSRELYREIMRNGNSNERHFKEMVDEFVQLIEKKLSDAEFKMFDDNTSRATSPSLFDMLNDLKTCLTLLRRTEIQSLMNVFDNVLKLHCGPSALPETDQAIATPHQNEELQKLSQYALDQLKIVQIEKGYQPLGLTISRTDAGAIHIARIVVGGLAASTELFQVNDRILEINDQSITGHSLDYVCTLMSSTTGVIKFLLAPPTSPNHISYESFHVRVLYTYDPYNDPLLPCKELGLAFQRGDVLRIVARDDHASNTYSSWWQAYREMSPDRPADACLAGLVPSDSLQRKRADLLRVVSDESESISSSSPSLFDDKRRLSTTCFTCVSSKHERKPFQMVYNNASFIRDSNEKETPTIRTSTNHFSLKDTRQFDEEQPPTTLRRFPEKDKSALDDCFRYYEPVFQLDLTAHKATRPIVLLGAPNVGRHELRRRLLQTEPDLFDVAIPHTTRARRLQETPDVDYHFVSEADFLARVASHSFVEFGQYDQALYGTSVDDIRQVVQSKRRVCILNLNPDAIRTFNKSDLYPYVICIAAPSFDRLRRLELDRREQLSDKEYREIIRKSRSIERRHHTLFDHILVNNDLERTYAELRELIARVHHEQQHWVRTCYRRAST